MSLITIDCEYIRKKFAAAYLLTDGPQAAFIENNTAHSVPILLQALKQQGLRPEQVQYLIVTHVHLDHAGGSSALIKACPNATLLAHPRAAPHLIDPADLVASARKVYGDDGFEKLYGKIDPIDAKRIRVMKDGEELSFGARKLRFIYTRGHANHHFCIHDSATNGVFTGDSFGIAYPDLQANGLFIFPSTTPTGFDPEQARLSVEKIVGTGAERAFLTHFGEITAIRDAAADLLEQLDFLQGLLNDAVESNLEESQLLAFCKTKLRDHFIGLIRRKKIQPEAMAWDWMKLDWELNAAGIAHAAVKRRSKAARPE